MKDNDAILQSCDGTSVIGNQKKLCEHIGNGIIFDTIKGKIYINNKPINHNEILTQS
jgi:hypothetical protein